MVVSGTLTRDKELELVDVEDGESGEHNLSLRSHLADSGFKLVLAWIDFTCR